MHGNTSSSRARPAAGAAVAALLAFLAGVVVPQTARAAAAPIAVPADGTAYFSVHLGEDPAAYVRRSGLAPAAYGHFAELPLTATAKQSLSAAVDGIRAQGGRLLLTVEPHGGLQTVTAAVAEDLAATLAGYNGRGVEVFLRFGHEMNGSWYAWGQQPSAYVTAFRRVAEAVRAAAPATALVWSPNYGGGYPYAGGSFAAQPGTTDFPLLDTDGDGRLSMADDPYSPYYPGDAYVDWVGMTLYHFGHAWPYGENEVPEPGKFAQQMRGTYDGNGLHENQTAVPDFYQEYAADRGKPMAITETGALFNENHERGASEYELKSAWIEQVYGASTQAAFPLLKMVDWFEIRKYEAEASGTVDWRATANSEVLATLTARVSTGAYVFGGNSAAPAPAPTPTPTPTVAIPGAPTSLSGHAMNNPTRVVLTWAPPASNGGSAITGYQACPTDTRACVSLSADTTTVTFDFLQRKTRYGFTVSAVNSAGTGAAASVTVRTK